jgi:glycosyltransferase involved in cell wall biosynthesis
MKVLVFTTRVPFIHGGAEELRDHLVINLREQGVDAEAMSLPFTWDPAERLIEEMWIARTLELANVDRLIALKFPAFLIPHSNKVLWVLHQYRQAYDLWDAGQSNIPDTPRGAEIRRMIYTADAQAFAEARALFTNSPTGRDRMRRYNRVEPVILPPPLNDPELFGRGQSDGYVFAGGRVGRAKRQALLAQALEQAPGLRMVIAGPPDTPADAPELARLAADLGVADRLTLDLRFLPRAELAALVNNASAVAYIPFDEDSVGYVTMEAFQAGKPVITTSDSGGVLEIVRTGETGIVAEPTAESLGAAFRAVIDKPAWMARLGAAGRQALIERELTWPRTIEKLLS